MFGACCTGNGLARHKAWNRSVRYPGLLASGDAFPGRHRVGTGQCLRQRLRVRLGLPVLRLRCRHWRGLRRQDRRRLQWFRPRRFRLRRLAGHCEFKGRTCGHPEMIPSRALAYRAAAVQLTRDRYGASEGGNPTSAPRHASAVPELGTVTRRALQGQVASGMSGPGQLHQRPRCVREESAVGERAVRTGGDLSHDEPQC